MPNRKKEEKNKRNSFIKIGLTEEENQKIKTIAETHGQTLSKFCRNAIFETIRKIEHPEEFNQVSNSGINSTILEQLTLNTKKIIELQEETNRRFEIGKDIEDTRQLIQEEYEKLKKKGLITDHSKDAEIISNMLTVHKSLNAGEISKKTGLDVETVILILQINDLFKLNVLTGRYELR